MDVEQRVEQLERQNKRFKVALIMLTVALCAVVTMAATELKNGDFDVLGANMVIAKTLVAHSIAVVDDQNKFLVTLTPTDSGTEGRVITFSSNGKKLVELGGVDNYGAIATFSPNGKNTVLISKTEDGGSMGVFNKTGEGIVQLRADSYGNGEVNVFNRKGKGRVYDSQ